jgi:hypothetical protein
MQKISTMRTGGKKNEDLATLSAKAAATVNGLPPPVKH